MNKAEELRELVSRVEVPATVAVKAKKHAAVMEQMAEALRAMLRRDERNTCQHEDTHRGGYLWEICDDCGAMWADDRGGKPEWKDPQEWVDARAALRAFEGTDHD